MAVFIPFYTMWSRTLAKHFVNFKTAARMARSVCSRAIDHSAPDFWNSHQSREDIKRYSIGETLAIRNEKKKIIFSRVADVQKPEQIMGEGGGR